ncbi:MAG TPA: TldD/PmbA family protein [archaeon]|nr:TldD/PmbA family protein [archaeon]
MSKEIFDLCQIIAREEKVEFLYSDGYSKNIRINGFGLSKISNQEASGLLIRVIVNGYSGFTTITNITEKNIRIGIDKAKRIAKLKKGTKIVDFGNNVSKIKTKQDKDILNFDISSKFKEIKSNLTKEKHIKSYEGGLTWNKGYSFYINPYTFKEDLHAVTSFGLMVNTLDKRPSSASASQVFTKVKDIDYVSVIDEAKKEAKTTLNPKQGEKGEYDLIFSFDATASILSSFIIHPTIGELMFKKQSYLSSSLGKSVFSKNLTITEDPFLDYFSHSESIDDEGFKTSKKDIIKNGKFNTSIYDQEYSILAGKKPTGNGFRDGIYSPVTCNFTNLVVSPGKTKKEDIISKTKKGIYVYDVMGIHTSNMTSGEFSLTINSGKEIINGKYKDTITNLNFTGNASEMFKTLEMSKELKFFGSAIVPEMVIPKVKLI